MSDQNVRQTNSEELCLSSRGYKLIKKLGEGSYARVYLAEYTALPDHASNDKDHKIIPKLACKVIDTSKAPKDFVRKFLPRELDILIKLNHPHIIHIHSIFQRKTKYFLFMRCAENGDLLDFVLNNGAVAESQARVWTRQLCLGLQYLHELEIAHRDFKCENVLITSNFNVKIADFGFARFTIDSFGKRVLSETYCGSLSYAAPEILRGQPYNPKIADIWSLGVVVYIMLNKAMPFDDTNAKRLYEQQLGRRWNFRAKIIDSLSEQVKHLVKNILEPDVTRRWRIDQILNSEWNAMDPRLLTLTSAEAQSLKAAVDETRRRTLDFERAAANKSHTSKKNLKLNEKKSSTPGVAPTVATALDASASGNPDVNIIKEHKLGQHDAQPSMDGGRDWAKAVVAQQAKK